MSMRVYPLPGAGLVVRAGDLIAVCADAGPETDALVALVQRAAADGAGGDPVGRLAGQLGADGVPCAVAGPVTDRTASVLVRGAASAEVVGAQERLHLHGPVLTHRTVDGPLRTVRLTLPGHGAPDRRTALDAGVVSGAGLLAEIVQPFEQFRRPDRSAPFEASILLPGHAEAPPAVPPPSADDAATRPLVEGVYCRDDHFNDPDQRYCQICGISMAQLTQVSRLGPRPPLGLLLLDDGSTLRLDTDYVVGREPDSDRDVVAARARAAADLRAGQRGVPPAPADPAGRVAGGGRRPAFGERNVRAAIAVPPIRNGSRRACP